MSQAEAVSAPPSSLDAARFFAAPPSSPSALVDARRELMCDAAAAEKFEHAVREARQGGNQQLAAAGSWVTGEYAKAIELVSGDDDLAQFILGSSLLETGQVTEASKVLTKAAGSSDPALSAAALYAIEATNDFDALESAMKKAKLDPADATYFAARLIEANGDPNGAIVALEAAVETNPGHVPTRFRLALISDLFGNDEDAMQHYESLLTARPIPEAVLLNLGVLYEDHNQFEKACGCYGAVLRRNPQSARARLYWKDAHESLDMFYDEELERKEDRLMQVLRTPISEFELSVRARNCLANMDIRTLGDLVSHSEIELLEFKNFGETSLNEIKRVLAEKGLRLGLRREDGTFMVPDEFDASEESVSELELAWLGELSDEQREALELQISSLNLSVRCHRVLVERLNLQRVGDILRYTEEDLLSMPNFGVTSLNELTSKLAELGLKLRTGRGEDGGPTPEEPIDPAQL